MPAADAPLELAVQALMQREGVQGLALAVIRDGAVDQVLSLGSRDVAAAWPLTDGTIVHGASFTKTAVAYLALQLVDENRLDLDAGLPQLLPKPLPHYTAPGRNYSDLLGDERWRRLSPRVLLSHGSGFANFRWLEPDGRLRFHFEPGVHYAYSGEGYRVLQLALESVLGIGLDEAMDERVFAPLGMADTAMVWRPDFADRAALGYDIDGEAIPHDRRAVPDAAGSMDTTIRDQARFWAALVRGDGLSEHARREMFRAQRPITSAQLFPTLPETRDAPYRDIGLAAGLGVLRFAGPQGLVWFKGGHDAGTANMAICVQARRDCLVLMSNDVRAERIFPAVSRRVLGATGLPWSWEYGGLSDTAN